jgi:hypothetical protein
MKANKIIPALIIMLFAGINSCKVEPYDEKLEFFQSRIELTTDFVEITDTSMLFHTELIGGYGQKINWVGHFWGEGTLPPFPYFMQHVSTSSDLRIHDLRIYYDRDTIFSILPAVRFNDSITFLGERIIVFTSDRWRMKNYLK